MQGTRRGRRWRRPTARPLASIFFILGFSVVFVSLGAAASAIGQFLLAPGTGRLRLLTKVAGAVVIVFGLHTMGVLRIGWLYSRKARPGRAEAARACSARFVVGLAFAFGWTPCIGPILAGILAVAGSQETVGRASSCWPSTRWVSGVPFLITALAINHFFAAFAKIRRHYHTIEIVSGLLLVAIGVLIFTDQFTIIARWLTPYLPTF